MEDKMLIKRNGTEFYRKRKKVNFEKHITFRYSEEKVNKLKLIAENMNIKYQTLIKQVLDEYLKKESD